jgi:hypothetical protein
MSGVICCEYCENGFDPIRFRWRCPHCGFKADCCTGEAQCAVVADVDQGASTARATRSIPNAVTIAKNKNPVAAMTAE